MSKPARPRRGEPIRLVLTSTGAPRYRVVIDVSPKGSPRRQVTSTHRSLSEARNRVAQVRADVTRGVYLAPTKTTFKELAADYLARVERGDHGRKAVRPATLAGYRAALNRSLPLIGSRRVADLTYQDMANMVDAMSATHSIKSVALALTMVRSVLAHGMRQRLVGQNVAEGVSPKGRPARKRAAYTAEQVRALSAAAEGDRLGGVWALILLGLRRGEALGARWSDIDWDARTMRISRSRVWVAGGFTDNDPKTERGRRIVSLDPVTMGRLRTMRTAHAEERLAIGMKGDVDAPLATSGDGSPLRPEALTAAWRLLCARAKVPYLGLHAARHAQVKVLRAAGVPDGIIAARLGHNETVMRDTYGVPNQDEQNRAAAVMADLLSG